MTESFEELFRALHQFKKLNVVSMLPDELTKSFRPSPRLKLQKIREKWKSKTVWFVSNMSTSDIRVPRKMCFMTLILQQNRDRPLQSLEAPDVANPHWSI